MEKSPPSTVKNVVVPLSNSTSKASLLPVLSDTTMLAQSPKQARLVIDSSAQTTPNLATLMRSPLSELLLAAVCKDPIGAKCSHHDLVHVGFTALTGFGLGIGLVTLMINITRARLPNYAAMIMYGNLGLAFVMVVLIAAISSYFDVRRVLRIKPFDIFRG